MGFQEEFQQFKQSQQRAPNALEFAPGQFKQGEFDEFKRREQEALAKPETTSRFPVLATVAGLAAGSLTFAATKSPALSAAAASIAAGNGELLQNVGETLFDLPTKPPTPLEAAKRIGKETLTAGLSEVSGQFGVKALQRLGVFRLFSRSITPEAESAFTFFAGQPGKVEPVLLPAQATENKALDILHNIAEHALFTRGFSAKVIADERQHTLIADKMMDIIAPSITPDQAANLFVASAEENFRILTTPAALTYNTVKGIVAPRLTKVPKTELEPILGANGQPLLGPAGQPLFKQTTKMVETLQGGVRADFTEAKKFAKPLLEELNRNQRQSFAVRGGDTLERAMKMPDNPYVSDLIAYKQSLNALKRSLEQNPETRNSPHIGVVKQLLKFTDRAIFSKLDAVNPEAAQFLRVADELYRQGSQQFRNRVLRRAGQMARLEGGAVPENIVDLAFAAGKTTRMKVMKNAVSPAAWQNIARVGMEKLLTKSEKNGVINGEKLLENLIGRSGLGERGLVTAVGEVQAQNWIAFANAIKVRQAKVGAGEGSMFIQLAQPRAFAQAASQIGAALAAQQFEFNALAGVILIGPAAVQKLMMNPRTANLLIRGVSLDTQTKFALRAGLAAQLAQALIPRKVEKQPPRTEPLLPEGISSILPALTR